MNAQQIEELVSLQRTFFETGTTLSLDFRLQSLKKLHDAILRMEPQINAALKATSANPQRKPICAKPA